jgi:peptidoglycan/LPS O-acetylase OafA/YrhL
MGYWTETVKFLRGFNLSSFQRASSQRFIPEIDALRFFAIVPVLLVHMSAAMLEQNSFFDRELIDKENTLRHLLLLGNSGVLLFFGISGFILTLPFINKPYKDIGFKKYFIRRLVRIEPPYIIAITIFFIVHIVMGSETLSFLWDRYLASFFYVHNIVYLDRSFILPVAWSLEVEVQFYVLMPLFLYIFQIWKSQYWRYFIYLIMLVLSLKVDLVNIGDLNDYMKYFVAGIFAADIYRHYSFKRHWIWDIVFVVSMILFYKRDHNLIMSISLFFIIISAFNTVYLKAFLSNKVVTIVGGMCYTLYLLHYPLYHLIMKFVSEPLTLFESFEANYFFQMIIILPVSILLMSVYYLVVEKPFMVLSQKLSKSAKPKYVQG